MTTPCECSFALLKTIAAMSTPSEVGIDTRSRIKLGELVGMSFIFSTVSRSSRYYPENLRDFDPRNNWVESEGKSANVELGDATTCIDFNIASNHPSVR